MELTGRLLWFSVWDAHDKRTVYKCPNMHGRFTPCFGLRRTFGRVTTKPRVLLDVGVLPCAYWDAWDVVCSVRAYPPPRCANATPPDTHAEVGALASRMKICRRNERPVISLMGS